MKTNFTWGRNWGQTVSIDSGISIKVLKNIISSVHLCDFPSYKHGEHSIACCWCVGGPAMNSSAFVLAIRHPAHLYIDPNPRPRLCQWLCVCFKREREGERQGIRAQHPVVWGLQNICRTSMIMTNYNSFIVSDCVCSLTDELYLLGH